MVQRVQVELVDDLNGETADETVRFGIDGTEYEIDLTAENASKLRATISNYVESGRKASTGRRNQSTSKAGGTASRSKRVDTQQIRTWAQENGYNPSSRGRINQTIIDAYNEAQK